MKIFFSLERMTYNDESRQMLEHLNLWEEKLTVSDPDRLLIPSVSKESSTSATKENR